MFFRRSILAASILLMAASALAQTTGSIAGRVDDSSGGSLPGVTVEAKSPSLQAGAKPVVANTPTGFRRNDGGVDVGGYVVKDKLWFFGAYDRVRNGFDNVLEAGPDAGTIVTSNSRRNLGSAKLTFNAAPNQSIVFTFLQDPRVDTGAINDSNHTLIGEPSTYLGRQDFGGRDYAVRYDGNFASQ